MKKKQELLCMKVYEAILLLFERNGIPPTARELAKECGYASANAITQHLKELRERNLIVKSKRLDSRSILPVKLATEIKAAAGRELIEITIQESGQWTRPTRRL